MSAKPFGHSTLTSGAPVTHHNSRWRDLSLYLISSSALCGQIQQQQSLNFTIFNIDLGKRTISLKSTENYERKILRTQSFYGHYKKYVFSSCAFNFIILVLNSLT